MDNIYVILELLLTMLNKMIWSENPGKPLEFPYDIWGHYVFCFVFIIFTHAQREDIMIGKWSELLLLPNYIYLNYVFMIRTYLCIYLQI